MKLPRTPVLDKRKHLSIATRDLIVSGVFQSYVPVVIYLIIVHLTHSVFALCLYVSLTGLQGASVPGFQPRAYPMYAQPQHVAALRAPGLYNPNQRVVNGASTSASAYYGAPVMVSPGGYLGHVHHGAYYQGGEMERGNHAAYGHYAANAGRYHPVYGAGAPPTNNATSDLNSRSTFDPRTTIQHQAPPAAANSNPHSHTGMDFSRTVSSSFGETNSNENKKELASSAESEHKFESYYTRSRKNDDDRSVASKADSDRSWKLLNQVASICEEEERARSEGAERLGATSPIDEHSHRHQLDSTERSVASGSHRPQKFSNMPSPSKLAPLNSLSSVASVQEPLDTSQSKDELDLIQCASSGSLLFNTHDDTYAKRPREDREDREEYTRGGDMDEIRKAASGSPPNVGNLSMKDDDYEDDGRPMKRSRSTNEEDFYDQPPSYTFSLESATSFSKDQQFSTLPELPENTKQSSYLGPLEASRDKNDAGRDNMLAPSKFWEIKGQDSFNGLSVDSNIAGKAGDGPVFGTSFSFESKTGEQGNGHDGFEEPSKYDGRRSVHSQDSRMIDYKQDRELNNNKATDSNHMDTTTRPSGTEKYPPLSATWVTASSSFNRDQPGRGRRMPTGLYGTLPPQVRNFHPNAALQAQQLHVSQMKNNPANVLRNYSHDSSDKTSQAASVVSSVPSRMGPIHGPYGTILPPHIPQSDSHLPPSFRPPHPALAGQVNIRAPPQAVYIMSSPPGGRPSDVISRHVSSEASSKATSGGVYNWTKEDDARLTDIMKKFKNPKDWEPIAKEFGRGKS